MGVRRAEYVLLSRAGCHLCDEMERSLAAVLGRHGLPFEVVDVDSVEAYQARFGEVIPVLLRDGSPVAKVRTSEVQLERIVRRRREPPTTSTGSST